MNKLVLSLCLAGAMALPALADARPVTLTTQMKAHGGDGAYLIPPIRFLIVLSSAAVRVV